MWSCVLQDGDARHHGDPAHPPPEQEQVGADGVEVGGGIFLVPGDDVFGGSRVGEIDTRLADVQDRFARHRGGTPLNLVFLLDCCRGRFCSSSARSCNGLLVDAPTREAGMLAGKRRGRVENSAVIFSTWSGDTAGDGRAGEGGPFTNIFTEELLQNRPGACNGGAWRQDARVRWRNLGCTSLATATPSGLCKSGMLSFATRRERRMKWRVGRRRSSSSDLPPSGSGRLLKPSAITRDTTALPSRRR